MAPGDNEVAAQCLGSQGQALYNTTALKQDRNWQQVCDDSKWTIAVQSCKPVYYEEWGRVQVTVKLRITVLI